MKYLRVVVLLESLGLAWAFYHNAGSICRGHKPFRVVLKNIEVGVPGLVSLFTDIFSTNSRTTSPTSVLEVQLKQYDQHGTGIKIHPLDYDPVDVDAEVATAIAEITNVVGLPPRSEHKGPIHIVRGTGGGKSFALSVVRNTLANSADILPLLITFVPPGSTDDFQALATLFPRRPDVGLALAIVSRMAGTYYGTGRTDVVRKFYTHESALTKLMDGAMSGRDIIACFVVHLAQQANVKKVVLMVDGYDECSWALRLSYSQRDVAAEAVVNYLSDAMLAFEYDRYGMSGALVLSDTTPATTAIRTSARVRSLRLKDSLDPSAVVTKRFLVDIDVADRSRHSITPEVTPFRCSDATVALRALELVATIFCSTPRGLECVHDELRRLVDRTGTTRKLVLTAEKMSTVLSNAMAAFREEYPRLLSAHVSPHHMYALLFGAPVPLDDCVVDGISKSLWINSLCPGEFPTSVECSPCIKLRSSLVSLYATVAPEERLRAAAAQVHLCQVFEAMTAWPTVLAGANPAQFDAILVDIAMSWIRLKLTAAAQASKPFITVKELLHVNSVEVEGDTIVERYLAERIPLPSGYGFTPEPLHRMQTTLYTAGGVPRKAATQELDAIRLVEEVPCMVLQAAPQDTWDYGLLFLGRRNGDGTRPRRLLLFDNGDRWVAKPARVDAANQDLIDSLQLGVPLMWAGHNHQQRRAKQRARQSRYFNKSAQHPQDDTPGGAGQLLAHGDYLNVYHTTEGMNATTFAGNVLRVCERDTSDYFNFLYGPYKAMKALVEAVTAPGKA
jgi:hypothetical protein